MTILLSAAFAFCAIATFIHLVSILIATVRCRPRVSLAPSPDSPPVTIIRPVCGVDNFVEDTLASSFALDYPRYEIVFCVANRRDPVVPLVQALIAAHPGTAARLLVGDDRVSVNPKLNNCVKGWEAAAHDWIAIADSNVLMPPDYIQRLLAAWQPDCGLICAPPIGSRPENFWAGLECAFLNTYQARWQYFSDTLGNGFAQGKTMLWRRVDLEAGGGISALGGEVAEDAAATKLVRGLGLEVHLVDAPFAQPPQPDRGVAPADTLGAAAPRLVPPALSARDPVGGPAAPARARARGRGLRLAGRAEPRRVSGPVVRRRDGARVDGRLAPVAALAGSGRAARPAAANCLARRSRRHRVRLARQRHERRRGRHHRGRPDRVTAMVGMSPGAAPGSRR